MFGPIKLPFRVPTICAECREKAGECEHTQKKPYKVLMVFSKDVEIPGYCDDTPLFEVTDFEPMPYEMPFTPIIESQSLADLEDIDDYEFVKHVRVEIE